ncbi:MAG TPA: glycosyltransferase family 2 protein [Kiritimatiellia bacterium]|nr:glycosyltransferase family 2 protein [Kiritimatiellia bacterium]
MPASRIPQPVPRNPRVSVIVGTYNCAAFLPGLWASLEAQTFRDFEIVVVDDASDDGETLPALEAMGDRIRLIRRAENSGTCELPRYQGTQAAHAGLCAFLDADDRWDPEFLERCVGYLEEHPEAALVHTAVRVIDGEDRVLRIRHEGVLETIRDWPRALLDHCFITISATVVRRDIWLAALPESEIRDFGMDQDFFLLIAKKYPLGTLPEVLASYRRSASSVSVKKWKRAPRNVNTLERIYRKGLWRGVTSRGEMRRIMTEAYLENARYWRGQGDPFRSRWFAVRGLRRNPISLVLWKETAMGFVKIFRSSR